MFLVSATNFHIDFHKVSDKARANPDYLNLIQAACLWSNQGRVNTTMSVEHVDKSLSLCRSEFLRKLKVIIRNKELDESLVNLYCDEHIGLDISGATNYCQASNRIKKNDFVDNVVDRHAARVNLADESIPLT